MQLRDLGRERVTRRVWGFGKENRAAEQGGGWVWKVGWVIVAAEMEIGERRGERGELIGI